MNTDDTVEAIAAELNSVAIHLVRRLRRADASLGITSSRLSALSVLVFGGPRSMNELADAEQVAGPTISKIVSALESAGLVARRAHPSDGRAVMLKATRKGATLMERGRRNRVDQLAAELRTLAAGDLDVLARAAHVLRNLESR